MDVAEVDTLLKNAKVLFNQGDIEKILNTISEGMNRDLKDKNPIVLGIMKGCIPFLGQLLPKLDFHFQFDYAQLSSYKGGKTAQKIEWIVKPAIICKDRIVVVIDDIIDSGLTMREIASHCYAQKAQKVYTVALVDKVNARKEGGMKKCDYTGFQVDENHYLVGYGLDYKEYLRNLPVICSDQ